MNSRYPRRVIAMDRMRLSSAMAVDSGKHAQVFSTSNEGREGECCPRVSI
jgi:hypothetical protein